MLFTVCLILFSAVTFASDAETLDVRLLNAPPKQTVTNQGIQILVRRFTSGVYFSRTSTVQLSDSDKKAFQQTPHLVVSSGTRQLWVASHRVPGEAFLKEDSTRDSGRWIRFLGYDLKMFLGPDPTKVLSPPLKRVVKLVFYLDGEDTAVSLSINGRPVMNHQQDNGKFELRVPVNRFFSVGKNTIDVETRSRNRWGGVNMSLHDVTGSSDVRFVEGFESNVQKRGTITLPPEIIIAPD